MVTYPRIWRYNALLRRDYSIFGVTNPIFEVVLVDETTPRSGRSGLVHPLPHILSLERSRGLRDPVTWHWDDTYDRSAMPIILNGFEEQEGSHH